ncbi:hypothetical protein ZIOFF_022123 [Zingiber officinale]|uniref:Uncharacterized protein n=2 Tax=Zingiber officinale TaxID=94328 RepID=A0A8J5LJY7_ZINOF|nr:hypothetical protein ZIOFF_022123 [Zingiber officinale]
MRTWRCGTRFDGYGGAHRCRHHPAELAISERNVNKPTSAVGDRLDRGFGESKQREFGGMEGKNSTPPRFPAIADEISNPATRTSAASPGYFSTVFPPASQVIAKDLSHSDLCWTLNKQRNEGRIAIAQIATTESPTKAQSMHCKDAKPVYANEYMEPPYLLSVNYGARDFYTSSSSSQTSITPEKFRVHEGDDSNNTRTADRGDWWQGSLYY